MLQIKNEKINKCRALSEVNGHAVARVAPWGVGSDGGNQLADSWEFMESQ